MGRGGRALRRQYLRLGTGELTAAAVFVAAAVLLDAGPGLWAALVPLLMIIIHGGVYWLTARRRIPAGRMGPGEARLHRAGRGAAVVLLVAGLAGMLAWWPPTTGAALLALAVWLFGVVEYLNYHVVRLAYPPAQWPVAVRGWRTPRLARDLRAATRP
ncbi:hypothetical protein WIS52_07250 [Pseudonocardia nematodicida]|uniref:Transmembrane protein n=1 Tax=Pseudonocardia nematodicida TaxID=1206997 RepID=A0ABV1K6Y5_9PSEU